MLYPKLINKSKSIYGFSNYNKNKNYTKTIFAIVGFLVIILFSDLILMNHCKADEKSKKITLIDDNLEYNLMINQTGTVGDFLNAQKIHMNETDFIFPGKDAKIFSGMKIIVERAKNITITSDGKTAKYSAHGKTVSQALWEFGIGLGEDDFTKPNLNYPIQDKDKIEVIRVEIRKLVVKKDIPFKTIENEDDKLSWRTKKITQKGEKGINEITYKVVSYNGKEISRKVLNEAVTKDPVTEVATQGTYMKLGKAKVGQGTWYSFRGGMFAASTTLPRGSYAKVTNTATEKSVVVQINDYGPFGKGRIIDLDKPAFQKIADLGAGVIGVKVEPIFN